MQQPKIRKPDNSVDTRRTDDIESKTEQVRAEVLRLVKRLQQARGHQTNTENILFDLLLKLDERIAALEK